MTDMAAQWAETRNKLEQFKKDIHDTDRSAALWRPFNVVVPTLLDALKRYANEAEAMASRMDQMFKDFDAGKGSARDLGEEIAKFMVAWRNCQDLYAAMKREETIAQESNPILGNKAPLATSTSDGKPTKRKPKKGKKR